MTHDTTVLVGGDVRCFDEDGTTAEALAWRDGRILAVGPEDEVRAAAGAGAEVVDAAGATVLPGFVDAHHHVAISVLYGGLLRARPPAVTDVPSLQRLLADASARLPQDRWLVVMEWDEALLDERRPPTRAELDEAVPDRPLFALHYTAHRALANSRALELAGIDRHTPDPSGGLIERGRGGEPTGLIVERGMSRVEALARASLLSSDREGFFERLAEHYRRLLAVGITCVGDTAVPVDMLAFYREAVDRGLVSVPTLAFPVSASGYLEEPWDALETSPTGTEHGPLAIGPVKLVFDGAPGCSMCLRLGQSLRVILRTVGLSLRGRSLDPVRTSLSIEPRLATDGKLRSGIALYRRAEAERVVRAASERGFALATHAIGNEAIAVALSAYEAAGPGLHGAGTARIEHGTFAGRELVSRMRDSGAAVVVQPYLVSIPAYQSAASIPGLPLSPVRWMLDAGITVAGSSDYPVAGFDPLDGIRAAVSRRTADGRVREPEQRVTLDEAIRMYTRAAAEACGRADRTGSIEVGKRADLVILDAPLRSHPDLATARVHTTVVGGVVHAAGS